MNVFMFLFVAMCLGIAGYAIWYEDRKLRKAVAHMRQLQGSRSTVPASEVARECGVDFPPDVIERVLRILAEVSEFSFSPPGVKVDPSRLRAEDVLWEDLGYDFDSLACFELQGKIEKEFGIRFRGKIFSDPPTVGDMVRYVVTELKKKDLSE